MGRLAESLQALMNVWTERQSGVTTGHRPVELTPRGRSLR